MSLASYDLFNVLMRHLDHRTIQRRKRFSCRSAWPSMANSLPSHVVMSYRIIGGNAGLTNPCLCYVVCQKHVQSLLVTADIARLPKHHLAFAPALVGNFQTTTVRSLRSPTPRTTKRSKPNKFPQRLRGCQHGARYQSREFEFPKNVAQQY